MRMLRCLLNDLRIQRRSGFWAVYAVLCALYLALALAVPASARVPVLAGLLFSDPCVLGFYFVGGFSYLERDDGTLSALLVTPLDWREHLAARALSFAVLAVAAAVAVALPPALLREGSTFRVLPLVLGVGLGSIFFTLVGLLPAARFRTVNDYIVAAELYLLPFLPPALAYYGLIPSLAAWDALPSGAALALLDLAVDPAARPSFAAVAAPSAVLAAWIAAAALAAASSFRKRRVEAAGTSAGGAS